MGFLFSKFSRKVTDRINKWAALEPIYVEPAAKCVRAGTSDFFILTKSCSMYNPTWGSVDVAYLALLAAISGPQRSDLGSQQGEKGVRARPTHLPKWAKID